MTAPIAGQTWQRGHETRVVTEVSENFVSAVVYGSRQRDRVICLKWQWERWSRQATLVGMPVEQRGTHQGSIAEHVPVVGQGPDATKTIQGVLEGLE